MRAAGSPLSERAASAAMFSVSPAGLCLAGFAVVLMVGDPSEPQVGDVVRYTEDLLGRPWRVTDEAGFGRLVVKNGSVLAIADPEEIEPYEGPSPKITPQMAGQEPFRQLVVARAERR